MRIICVPVLFLITIRSLHSPATPLALPHMQEAHPASRALPAPTQIRQVRAARLGLGVTNCAQDRKREREREQRRRRKSDRERLNDRDREMCARLFFMMSHLCACSCMALLPFTYKIKAAILDSLPSPLAPSLAGGSSSCVTCPVGTYSDSTGARGSSQSGMGEMSAKRERETERE